MNLLDLFAVLLALFGGIALSSNAKNKNAIIHVVAFFGSIALLLCAAATLATLSYQHCVSYRDLCIVSGFFTETLHLPVTDERIQTRVFLASGWFGAISIYLMLALVVAKQRTFQVLAFMGATALVFSSGYALWMYSIAA